MDWLPPRIVGGRNIWIVLFDGGVDTRAGQGGSGYAVVHHNTATAVEFGFRYSADYASNNVEEYRGMITGLRAVSRWATKGDLVSVMGDSQLITTHMNGTCKVGHKLRFWHNVAHTITRDWLVSFHWIRREVNSATDFLSKECRILRHWEEPREARTAQEWTQAVAARLHDLIQILGIMGRTIEGPCFYVASYKARTRRHHKDVLDEMALSHGHRRYYCMRPMKWIMRGSEREGVLTRDNGLAEHPRWKQKEEPKIMKVSTSKTTTDLSKMALVASTTTSRLRELRWDLAALVKEIRKEDVDRPNVNLRPDVYNKCLRGYGQLEMMNEIATTGVQALMNTEWSPPRPWPRNFKIDPLALPLIHHDYASLYNENKGMILNMGPVGHFCHSMAISPIGGVEKGGYPIWEKVRIIAGLSTPDLYSINANTTNNTPDACFGVVGELADRILDLRWSERLNQGPINIMGMSADIDSAFRQIPLSADSVKCFASRIPGTSLLFLPFDLVFGWTSSPGYFAVFAKAVRHLHRTRGSWMGCSWHGYWGFVWVDDIILIEPDLGSRLHDAEWNIRHSVERVFGPRGWKADKFESWSTRWKSLGLIWDSQTCTVEMPGDKLAKAVALLHQVSASNTAQVKTLQSLLGRLRHVIICVPAAKAFVQRIQRLVTIAGHNNKDMVDDLQACRKDLAFWKLKLETVNFTAWPLEFFGSKGTAAAIWTVGVLEGAPFVHWNGRGITSASQKRISPGLSECIWMILLAATQWMDIIRSMNIRAPRIMVLLGRADWADGFNKGNVWRMGGQEAMRQLAAFQMHNRISFTSCSWKQFGNKTPAGWRWTVDEAHKNLSTNVCQIGNQLKDWMHMPCLWLCNPCLRTQVGNTMDGSIRGANSQRFMENLSGFTTETTIPKHSRWFGLSRTWHRLERTSGVPFKVSSPRCALCTGSIITSNWSRTIPSSPWWRKVVARSWTTRDLGNQCRSK